LKKSIAAIIIALISVSVCSAQKPVRFAPGAYRTTSRNENLIGRDYKKHRTPNKDSQKAYLEDNRPTGNEGWNYRFLQISWAPEAQFFCLDAGINVWNALLVGIGIDAGPWGAIKYKFSKEGDPVDLNGAIRIDAGYALDKALDLNKVELRLMGTIGCFFKKYGAQEAVYAQDGEELLTAASEGKTYNYGMKAAVGIEGFSICAGYTRALGFEIGFGYNF